MFKLVVPQPLGSNRLEYDAILPFRETDSERYFLDAKGFVTEQPLVGTAPGAGFIQGYGQSARIGVRSLLDRGHAFRGVSLGYDNLWLGGAVFQQVGAALEYNRPKVQWVITAGVPVSAPNLQQSDAVPLASVNLQVSLPTGAPGLSVQPRAYVVGSDRTGTAVGGQLQFTYSFASSASVTLASNYDALTGLSGSLTFQVVLPQRRGSDRSSTIDPGLINAFAGAVGNNGSSVIRLVGQPSVSGN